MKWKYANSIVVSMSLPNVIKIDPYHTELYRVKFGALFGTQCILLYS